MKYTIRLFIAAFLLLNCCYSQSQSLKECVDYLKDNSKDPADYVISKFEKYDYVFLGEYHRIKHDVDFVARLIPRLYKNGVKNLAFEFYEGRGQVFLDSLLNAKSWDEDIFYNGVASGYGIAWGYSEYLNIIREVWKFNQTLPDKASKFRIVFIGPDFNACEEGLERFGGIAPDEAMANFFEKEIVSKKEKALIYCGIHHAFTAYHQPVYDFESNQLEGLNSDRFGNIIYKKYPGQTFTISMHYPWISDKGWDKPLVKPVNGAVDSVMSLLNNKPCGFDVKNTCMGRLRANDTYYAYGYNNFGLENFCDGYIFLAPMSKMESVSVEENFYAGKNFEKMKEFLKCVIDMSVEKLNLLTRQDIIDLVKSDANIEKRVEHLK